MFKQHVMPSFKKKLVTEFAGLISNFGNQNMDLSVLDN